MEQTRTNKRTILVRIKKVIFHNQENGTTIFSGEDENGKTRQVIGSLPSTKLGSIVEAIGFWKRHDRFGWQFMADDIFVLCPDPETDTRDAIRCRITSVRELRTETGFCSASGLVGEESKVRLSGRLKNMKLQSEIFALGEWHEDEQFGKEFKVKQWEFYKSERPGALQKCKEMITAIKMSKEAGVQVLEFPWSEVQIRDNMVGIPYPKGRVTWCTLSGARESYDLIKPYLAGRLPALQICFDNKGIGMVLNASAMRDAITLMHVSHTLRYGQMETREKNRDIMEAVGEMSPDATKVFVPRDETPYLDFLQEKQSEFFNIVPIEEYNGGSREHAFLFTIMIGERPCIIWENANPSRATFAFPCTDENYDDKLRTICSFIADERGSKRQYIHSDASAVTFGEKPVLLVHNTIESWTERLMKIIK